MEKWISSFGFLPIDYQINPYRSENETQRIYIRNNLSGSGIRLLFSNLYGKNPLHFDKVSVSGCGEDHILNRRGTAVTFCGREDLVLEPGQECFSDEIPFETHCGEWITVSSYLSGTIEAHGGCSTSNREYMFVEYLRGGDFTEAVLLEKAGVLHEPKQQHLNRDMFFYGLSRIDILTEAEVRTVTVFGDSITHIGHWSGPLARRLYERYPGKVVLLNRGIGGNRLCGDYLNFQNWKRLFGEAGVRRFEKDVFEDTAAHTDLVILLEGVNDLNYRFDEDYDPQQSIDADRLTAATESCIRTAHAHDARILIGTVIPEYNYNGIWNEETEAIRQQFNAWIRSNSSADGFLDFDRSVRDPDHPAAMKPVCDCGDHLHPSAEGGRRMAEDIDLTLIDKLLWE